MLSYGDLSVKLLGVISFFVGIEMLTGHSASELEIERIYKTC